jgi:hypothetical protein
MLAHYGWLYTVAGFLLAIVVAIAIPYAAGRSDGTRPSR